MVAYYHDFFSLFAVPPSIWIQYQLVGAYDGQQITLECHSEAYPKSINYWTRDKGEIIPHSMLSASNIINYINENTSFIVTTNFFNINL